MHLEVIEGFQARHSYSALHEVEPKRETSRVSSESQRGQRTLSASRIGPVGTAARPLGGAISYSRSFRLPSSDIQSVVQAGDSTSRTDTEAKPAAVSASTTSSRIASIAGQPL